ncbi:hypothetical protein SVIOM74S_08852 [Streptomyces violarus]
MLPAGEGPQPADEQQVLLHGRLALVVGEPLGGLEHHGPRGVPRVVADDPAPVRGDGLALRAQRQPSPDQLAPLGEELHVDVGEGFEARTELRLRPAHAPGHRPYASVTAGEQRDDPVRLTQLLGAQHDAVVAEQTHGVILAGSWRQGTSPLLRALAYAVAARSRSAGVACRTAPGSASHSFPAPVRPQLHVGPLMPHDDADAAAAGVHDIRADRRLHRGTAASRRVVRTEHRANSTSGQGASRARLTGPSPNDGRVIPVLTSSARNSFTASSASSTQSAECRASTVLPLLWEFHSSHPCGDAPRLHSGGVCALQLRRGTKGFGNGHGSRHAARGIFQALSRKAD